MESALQTLARSIERGEGPGLLIGASGTGKSLLCQMLARQFADRFAVAQLASGRLATRSALLQAILYELGLPYRGMDEGELRLSLLDFLEPTDSGTGGLLLLADEAQTLPLRLLEEIRLITNLVRDGQPRVRVVLAGSPQLEERFASPKLSSFAQRLAARCYLDALDAEETAAYVRAEIVAVGGHPETLVNNDTLRSVYRASDGIPRLINQVCDHALMLASLGGAHSLSSEAIEEAWADMQQLPTPWSAGSSEAAEGGVIEFGQLDDTADDTPEAIPFRSQKSQPLHVASTDELSGEEGLDGVEDGTEHQEETGSQDIIHALNVTEVDLDFPEFGDPHAEQFAEEEVVLDRYPLDADLFAEAPRVSSWESRQLASMLAAYSVSTPANKPQSEPPIVGFDISQQPAGYEPDEAPIGCEPISSFAVADIVPIQPTDFTQPVEPPTMVAHVSGCATRPQLGGPRESLFWAGANAAGDEHQLIIIEDQAPSSVHQASRRPYRQLFAKLRRG